jgi:hypothetical protein
VTHEVDFFAANQPQETGFVCSLVLPFVSKRRPKAKGIKMRINRPVILSLSLAFVLGACTPKYLAPTTGPTAQVRLKMESPEVFATLFTFEGPGCKVTQSLGAIGGAYWVNNFATDPDRGLRPKMLGSSGVPDPQVIEVLVPANKRLNLFYQQIGPHSVPVVRGCMIAISFEPEEQEQYEVRYRYAPPQCVVQVSRMSGDDGRGIAYSPVPGVTKESNSCK